MRALGRKPIYGLRALGQNPLCSMWVLGQNPICSPPNHIFLYEFYLNVLNDLYT